MEWSLDARGEYNLTLSNGMRLNLWSARNGWCAALYDGLKLVTDFGTTETRIKTRDLNVAKRKAEELAALHLRNKNQVH